MSLSQAPSTRFTLGRRSLEVRRNERPCWLRLANRPTQARRSCGAAGDKSGARELNYKMCSPNGRGGDALCLDEEEYVVAPPQRSSTHDRLSHSGGTARIIRAGTQVERGRVSGKTGGAGYTRSYERSRMLLRRGSRIGQPACSLYKNVYGWEAAWIRLPRPASLFAGISPK